MSGPLEDPLEVVPLGRPPVATVKLPGSKSITNRALVCAALAEGTSTLRGALLSEDTEAMLGCLAALGIRATIDSIAEPADGGAATVVVEGADGAPPISAGVLDARSSGTTSRFIAPLCVATASTFVLDGTEQLRARPMNDLWEALEALGAAVEPLGTSGGLPVEITGPREGIRARSVEVRGDASSQFLSGLLLAAPVMPKGLEVVVDGDLVSAPYVEMTLAVMEAFGATVSRHDDLRRIVVAPGGYVSCDFQIEPDASAASYFFALAAASGGELTVAGLFADSLQGDIGFADVLAEMGAQVEVNPTGTTVRGTGNLQGITVDMSQISDSAPTIAAIAPLAAGETTVEGIGFIRHKESDRVGAVVAELRQLGVEASETDDGFTVRAGDLSPGVVNTYADHRMAMSFAVLGLLTRGISIADPGCVVKTFPGFWDAIERLRSADADTRGGPSAGLDEVGGVGDGRA